MWYAIIGGAGLALGLSLMAWALSERSKRHRAERIADERKRKEQEALDLAEAANRAVDALEKQCARREGQLQHVRQRLTDTRNLLHKHAPIGMVAKWLDEEGKKKDL